MRNSAPEFIILGTILRPQGRHGEVKTQISFHNPEKLPTFKEVFLGDKRYTIVKSAVRQGYWYITFEGIDSMEQAETLRNQAIAVPFASVEKLPSDSFYHFELIGFDVVGPDRQSIGKVSRILTHPAVDSLVIENSEPKIIPLAESIIEKIDKESCRIHLKINLDSNSSGR